METLIRDCTKRFAENLIAAVVEWNLQNKTKQCTYSTRELPDGVEVTVIAPSKQAILRLGIKTAEQERRNN